MIRVEFTPQADALFGLIQKRYTGNSLMLAELEAAYFRLFMDLRTCHPSIWLLPSSRYEDTAELYDPPLRVHFRRIHDGMIGVVDVEEIHLEL